MLFKLGKGSECTVVGRGLVNRVRAIVIVTFFVMCNYFSSGDGFQFGAQGGGSSFQVVPTLHAHHGLLVGYGWHSLSIIG